jgi:hypothetical protein
MHAVFCYIGEIKVLAKKILRVAKSLTEMVRVPVPKVKMAIVPIHIG